ncbi:MULTISPECIES: aspartate/glutamate racemase family protein [unclassified Curtobacterium]|uniref:aspartate/glutamate racemase family protein n=1 Tax=unclassified Curtobacterium TaxID=257496 RepID=UPI001AEA4748|nr:MULTISPECIES: aspartate/glutamate racemase family protein [unclassified Curtobacterium]MBP1302160.1 allantoin racemase [Curtobacterium sp. 1310]MCM3520328.1 aspartate/glutamate racemase family protein [Curtobacterium sp. P97]MDB6425496.1 aspartate/glutamate racemase family protein [Curtobacterium sp. 20TX0008]MDT0211079.1 aspartate/glutamate racemase family protein [Curtobacterium sp. BRD11]
MRIRVVNPNTTPSMTASIGRAAAAVAGPGTVVEAVTPTTGPASIESHYEEALAVPGLLEQIALGEQEGVDAYVVACFGDPGLDAARELAAGPVLGIAEAGFHAAAMLGRRFGVVTTLARTTGRAWELAERYGFASRVTEVRACEVPVLQLDDPTSGARELVVEECRAVLAGGADAVVLGCAGMAAFCAEVSHEIGAPVVDGVAAATVLAESLVRLGLRTGKTGEYAPPPPKPVTGLLSGFTLQRSDVSAPIVLAGASA